MRCRVDIHPIIPAGLHRLDARLGLRPDVSDPLLRLLAQPRRAPEQVLHVLPTRRNLPSSFVFVSGGGFVRTGNRKAVDQESATRANRARYDPSWRGNLCLRLALSPAGICHCLGLGAAQRSVARGHTQHHRSLDDAHGSALLDCAVDRRRQTRKIRPGSRVNWNRSDDFYAHASDVDHMATALAAVAAGIVSRRCPQSWHSTSLAFPYFSLGRFRICRLGRWICFAKPAWSPPRSPDFF